MSPYTTDVALSGAFQGYVGSAYPDLTMKQLGIIFWCYHRDRERNTVRGLSRALVISKPVISRALDALGKHQYIVRHIDPNDRRSVQIEVTAKGEEFVQYLSDLFETTFKGSVPAEN